MAPPADHHQRSYFQYGLETYSPYDPYGEYVLNPYFCYDPSRRPADNIDFDGVLETDATSPLTGMTFAT